jgi:hypothetical protein
MGASMAIRANRADGVLRFAVWCGPAFLVLYLVFFVVVAGFIPPTPPSRTGTDVLAFFAEHRTRIQVGQIGAMIMSTLLFPFFAVVSREIARMERSRSPGFSILAAMQFGGGVLLIVYFQLCSMIWLILSFRADLDPSLARMLNDAAWLIFVMVFPAYVMQMLCMVVSAWRDGRTTPTWPRWTGYLNLWVALAGSGGGIAVFFTSGPFAWNGLIGFYLPIAVFAGWLATMTYVLLKGLDLNHELTEPNSPPMAAVRDWINARTSPPSHETRHGFHPR